MNERVAQSIDIVCKELSVLPHAVKVVLKHVDEARVIVHFEYDSYQLAMVDVLKVRPQQAASCSPSHSMGCP